MHASVYQSIYAFINLSICLSISATKSGKVLSLGVEKTHESSASLWRAAQELVDEDNNDEEEEQVYIKKVTWIAPQPPSTEGCLFVLLGNLTHHIADRYKQADRQAGLIIYHPTTY
jgi:hypothetical protein